MTNQEITHKINEFLSEEFEVGLEKISPEATLKDTLELDLSLIHI